MSRSTPSLSLATTSARQGCAVLSSIKVEFISSSLAAVRVKIIRFATRARITAPCCCALTPEVFTQSPAMCRSTDSTSRVFETLICSDEESICSWNLKFRILRSEIWALYLVLYSLFSTSAAYPLTQSYENTNKEQSTKYKEQITVLASSGHPVLSARTTPAVPMSLRHSWENLSPVLSRPPEWAQRSPSRVQPCPVERTELNLR